MKRQVLLFAGVALASCSPPAPEPSTSHEVSQNEIDAAGGNEAPSRASFAIDEQHALSAVQSLGGPWSVGSIVDDPRPDSLTGGSMQTIMSRSGSADIFALPNGRVWRITLRTGIGDQCGDPGHLVASLPKLLASVAPSAKLDQPTSQSLSAGLKTDVGTDAKVAGAKLSISGGCVAALYVTAA